MVTRLAKYLWGDFNRQEVKKFGILGAIFFFLIGSYWLLRTQKNAAFAAIVGFSYQPKAKLISWVASIFIVLLYSKLVDWFDKNRLLTGLAAMYGGGFILISYLLKYSSIGFANTVASPDRLFGWVIYLFTESFGTVMVGLFWAFVTSSTQTESAKKGYPLIIAGSQFGSILGSWLSMKSAWFGNANLYAVVGLGFLMIIPTVYAYLYFIPVEYRTGSGETQKKKQKTGMFEGLRILLTRPYVMGILGLTTLYEIIATILEFEMNMVASVVYPTKEAFASFNGMYGIFVNGLSLTFALIGTSFLMRRFGLRFCLLLFPIATAVVLTGVYFAPVLAMLTLASVVVKGLSYALNNPSKEMMYIPTSKDVRFKAKGWIDQFGGRSAKASGALINNTFSSSLQQLLTYGTMISFGIVGVWFLVAAYVGAHFKKLNESGEVVK